MDPIVPLLAEAERYLELEDGDRAAAHFARARALDQDRSALPAVGLARVALALGLVHQARALLEHVLTLHPRSVEALTWRGVVASAQQQVTFAVRFFEQALAIDSRYVPAHSNLGCVLAQLGRWPQARKAFRTALTLSPRQVALLPLLATAAARDGDLGEAIQVLTQLLRAHPDHLDGLVTLADVLVEAHLGEFAAELLENAVRRLPRVPVLHARRAALALRRGDLALARAASDAQLALAPADLEALLFAATLDLMQRDLARAEERVQRALALCPTSWRAHYQLGLIYDALRLNEAARAAYRAAMQHGPTAWEPRNNLATLLLEERTLPAAREARLLLEEALVLGHAGETLDAGYNLALALWQLGERGASEQRARQVAASPRECSAVLDARRFLENFAA